MSLTVLLVLLALLCAIAEALGKCPTWVVQVLLCVAMLVAFWGH